MSWLASPQADEDLIAARDFISADSEAAAREFLDATFKAFEILGEFP